MPVNPQIVKTRIRRIEECVARLREVGRAPEREYRKDRRLRDASERLFQKW